MKYLIDYPIIIDSNGNKAPIDITSKILFTIIKKNTKYILNISFLVSIFWIK